MKRIIIGFFWTLFLTVLFWTIAQDIQPTYAGLANTLYLTSPFIALGISAYLVCSRFGAKLFGLKGKAKRPEG
ncbi:hypothetical protein [Brucella anthropi]|uniref:hypothetical protein n=1 Tax=Brucella anthropi TaxID=529 RepID=UPI002361C564|nr:hypothetical protein [Brucella anthropi]